MKNTLKNILFILAGVSIGPLIAYAVQISVPSAPGYGYSLVSTTTGAYIATTTDPFHVGSIFATSTATSTLPNTAGTGTSYNYICLTSDICRTTWPAGGGANVISTTTPISISNLVYYTGTIPTTVGGVATTTLSGSGVIGVTAGAVVIGASPISVTCSTCGTGTVTSIAAGTGLLGGTITTAGTLSLSSYIATSSAETISNLAYWTSTGGTPAFLGKVSTTSLSVSGFPANLPSTFGALVGGSGTWTYWGLATTSQPASSNLLESNGAAGVFGVATTAETCGTGVLCASHDVLTGGGTIKLLSYIATSSSETISNIPYWTTSAGTPAKLGTVATSTLTPSAPLGGSFTVINSNGSAGTLTCTGCLTANQSITLSGAVTGTGATAITTAFGVMNTGVLTNAATAATIPTPQATSTLYGNIGAAGYGSVLSWNGSGLAFMATSTSFTGTAGQVGYFKGTGQLIGTSSVFIQTATGNVGIGSTSPIATLSVMGNESHWGTTYHFGNTPGLDTAYCGQGLAADTSQCFTYIGNDNSTLGAVMEVGNTNNGIHAYTGMFTANDLFNGTGNLFAGMNLNSSGYNDTTFGTGLNVANDLQFETNVGPISIVSATGTPVGVSFINFLTGGANIGVGANGGNERARITALGLFGVGTSTPFVLMDLASTSASTGTFGQLALTDINAGVNLKHWLLSSEGGNFFLGTTSDAFATSSLPQLPALTIRGSGPPSLSIGSTTLTVSAVNGLLVQGSNGANGSSTQSVGKWQVDGYNSAGTRTCIYVVGTTLTATAGACNP